MPIFISDLAGSELSKFEVDDNLKISKPETDGYFVNYENFEFEREIIRSRIDTLLRQDRKRRKKEDKIIPELEKTPYATLITKMCSPKFKPEDLSESERAIMGFLPIDIDKKRVGALMEVVAEKVAATYALNDEEIKSEIFEKAKQSVFVVLSMNLKEALKKSFYETPLNFSFLNSDISQITPKKLQSLIEKLKIEEKTTTEDLLKELGIEEQKIPYLNEQIMEAGKEAIRFYRRVSSEVAKGQIRFAADDKKGILSGELAQIDPYIEDSQADLFTLLDRAFSKEKEDSLDKGFSRKYEAQILLQIRYLYLIITSQPEYKTLMDSTSGLSAFTKNLLGNTTMKIVNEPLFEEHPDPQDETKKPKINMYKKYTLRVFEEGMPPIYMDDEMREKAWESIMLKIITGESASDKVVDMIAGQGAIYGINTEDLIGDLESSDYNRLERVEINTAYITRICIKTAQAMGCNEDLSDEELSDKGSDYHFLQPGQFKIVKRIHGNAKNEKTHDFSAFKVYMAVAAKNGSTQRIEFRYLPWDTYKSSKSKESLSGDSTYSLKKKLQFSKYAIRKSQNERFIEVVERLLEVLADLEETETVNRKSTRKQS